jgi:hypothetical protein
VFAPGGSIEYREVLTVGGCVDLLDALARDRELQIYEGGKLGDVELIRQGIETRSFLYGNSGISFRDAYQRELMPWLKDRLAWHSKPSNLGGSWLVVSLFGVEAHSFQALPLLLKSSAFKP